MSDKFNQCFIDELPDYEYDISFDGELLARGKSLSAADRSYIERQSTKKKFVSGAVEIDIDSHAMITHTIMAGLKSWNLKRKLSSEAVAMLTDEIRMALFEAIQDHENKATQAVEDNEKN